MTKEKQIEEMAKAVCVNCTSEVCASGRCAFQYDCPLSMETIKRLHRKGYRLASEVAKEIFAEIEDVLNNIGYFDEIDFKALKKKYTEDE